MFICQAGQRHPGQLPWDAVGELRDDTIHQGVMRVIQGKASVLWALQVLTHQVEGYILEALQDPRMSIS